MKTKPSTKKLTKLPVSEDDECLLLVEYLDILKKQGKVIAYTRVANGNYLRDWSQRNKNKAMGVSPGFPDYIVLLPKRILFIEMKRAKGGITSAEQAKWLFDLSLNTGAISMVCNGFEAARQMIDKELKAQLQKI